MQRNRLIEKSTDSILKMILIKKKILYFSFQLSVQAYIVNEKCLHIYLPIVKSLGHVETTNQFYGGWLHRINVVITNF